MISFKVHYYIICIYLFITHLSIFVDEGNVQKGKKGKGKRRKAKGGRAREHSEPSDHSDKEPGVTVESVADERQPDSSKDEKGSKNDVDEPDEQKVTPKEELQKTVKEKIVDQMADLHIERDVPEDKPEKEDEQVEEIKSKRDVTPTRKIERRNKPEGEASDVLDRLSGAAEKQKVTRTPLSNTCILKQLFIVVNGYQVCCQNVKHVNYFRKEGKLRQH